MTGEKKALVFLALLTVLAPAVTRAQRLADFVGVWYSETKGEGIVEGKKYDLRRELLTNRSDGTKTNTNRYYAGATLVAEAVGTYGWGVETGLYWTACRTIVFKNAASPCSNRSEYDIISVGAREIRYKSRQSGTTYSMLKVADDFRLP